MDCSSGAALLPRVALEIPPGQWPGGTGESPVPPRRFEICGRGCVRFQIWTVRTEIGCCGGAFAELIVGIMSHKNGVRLGGYPSALRLGNGPAAKNERHPRAR
jgi:hypothetical protein